MSTLDQCLPRSEVEFSESTWPSFWKHTLDMALAAILLGLTTPVMLVCMLMVKLTSPGPVIYSQVRVGYLGRTFTIYKIRTMGVNAERQGGPQWATPGDARVTPLGRVLRYTHLDELPQLWNILRGEMSLIGPRPERPVFVDELERALPNYRKRLLIRPGLSGLAQIHLPPDTDLDGVRRKLIFDLYYVQHASFWLDLRIMAGTALQLMGLPHSLARRIALVPNKDVVYRSSGNYDRCAKEFKFAVQLFPGIAGENGS